ncbi:MAG TPA: DUF3617 domain-containing protein [Candidatus Eisenbacteria bacterium]|nr:DUF3617 domain-containing protein [Candidatus Eisenbacteria bacterium]
MKSLNTHSQCIVTACSIALALTISLQGQTRSPGSQLSSGDHTLAKLQPLNVKPGLWETTVTHKVAGEMPIPPGMLDKLSAEQRARLEQRMKSNPAGSTSTSKSCVTKQDLEKSPDFGEGKGECTYTIQTSTSTEAKGKYSCVTEGMNATGALDIVVVDQGNVKGTSHGTVSGSGHDLQFDSSFTSKWVSANCHK